MAEGGYPEVDHMPGPIIKRTQTGCKRCHGKGYVYKTPDGQVHPTNQPDAKKYKCGKCSGIGFVKVTEEQGVAEGREFGSSTDEAIALKVFRENPNLNSENEVLDAAWKQAVEEMGTKRARYMFNYDEDFPSDLLQSYRWLQKNEQGVAEAGNKPLEPHFGMGDSRTPRELKTQMRNASDEFVKRNTEKVGPMHTKVAKMQNKLAKSELRRRDDHSRIATGINESKTKSKR